MKVSELISKLQAIQEQEGQDAEVALAVVECDRYGDHVSLMSIKHLDSDGDVKDELSDKDKLISKYFGSEYPRW